MSRKNRTDQQSGENTSTNVMNPTVPAAKAKKNDFETYHISPVGLAIFIILFTLDVLMAVLMDNAG